MNPDRTSPNLQSLPDPSGSAAALTTSPAGCDHAQRVAQLFRDEHDKVVHYLVARTRSWPEARDIAAQAFKQMLELGPESVIHPKAYLYRVARNIATDRAKLAAIRRRLNPRVSYGLPGSSPSPELALFEQQRMRILQRAIQALHPRCRMALVLRIWDGLSYAQILDRFAEVGLIVNERTVRRWIAHGLAQCRRQMPQSEHAATGEGS